MKTCLRVVQACACLWEWQCAPDVVFRRMRLVVARSRVGGRNRANGMEVIARLGAIQREEKEVLRVY
jgi:hypothetical protein